MNLNQYPGTSCLTVFAAVPQRCLMSRPEDEFNIGHVPGALNIPLAQLERRLAELPTNREIVAYCRGPWCVLSFEAVALLRNRGYQVRRLEDGFPEWKMAGLPTSQAAGMR